jgi:phage terminase small subunit
MAKTKENLSLKQKMFVDYYIANGFNGRQAALKAGYSPRTVDVQASKMLKLPKVQEYLSKRIKKVLSNTDQLSVQLISKLKDIAFSNVSDIMSWSTEGGADLISSDDLTDSQSYAISEISSTPCATKEGDIYGYAVRVKQADKLKALEMLAKFVKLYEDNKPDDEEETEVNTLTKQERTNKLLEYQEKLKSLKK